MLSPHLEHARISIPSTVVGRPGTWPRRKQMSRRKPIVSQIGGHAFEQHPSLSKVEGSSLLRKRGQAPLRLRRAGP
jgi:hypothetical protein